MESLAPTGSYLTPSFEHARVSDAMRPRVLTCGPHTPMVTVAQQMASEHVHAIVVLRMTVDREGGVARRPWGIVTDRDVLRCAPVIEDRTADDAAEGVLLVHPGDRLTDVAERMLEESTTHAVVVEPQTDRPVGVLSTLDIAGILGWGRG